MVYDNTNAHVHFPICVLIVLSWPDTELPSRAYFRSAVLGGPLKKTHIPPFLLCVINRPVGGALRFAWYRGNAPTTGRFLALAQSLDIATW